MTEDYEAAPIERIHGEAMDLFHDLKDPEINAGNGIVMSRVIAFMKRELKAAYGISSQPGKLWAVDESEEWKRDHNMGPG